MRSTNACMASGMANTDDGAPWETVLRFLETPTPADYSFEFDARIESDEGPPSSEENLLVDEYLFKQPHCPPRQTIYNSKSQKLEWKQVVDGTKSDGSKLINPAKLLKLTEIEMVQSLRRWKQVNRESTAHLIPIKEADVYALHPADLVSGTCTHYFYSATKYSCLKRPTRLRITENGCRWKQQGRIFPIRENGHTVAYKTYLSYVALKNGNSLPRKSPSASLAPSIDHDSSSASKEMVCGNSGKRRDRNWSLWTMEEVGLADDIQSERVILRRGGHPRPFPVICRIVAKREGTRSTPVHAKMKCKKAAPFRKESPRVAEPTPCDKDVSAAVSTVPTTSEVRVLSCLGNRSTSSSCTTSEVPIESCLGDHSTSTSCKTREVPIVSCLGDRSTSSSCTTSEVPIVSCLGDRSTGSSCTTSEVPIVSCLGDRSTSSSRMMTAQDILEDEIIRALIYDLPYRKVTMAPSSTPC